MSEQIGAYELGRLIDFAASQFLNGQWHVGVVGYIDYQLSSDSSPNDALGDFESRVL